MGEEISCYLKPCKDFLGEDWRPPIEIYNSTIDEKEPNMNFLAIMEKLAKVREMPKEKAVQKLKNFYLNSIYK